MPNFSLGLVAIANVSFHRVSLRMRVTMRKASTAVQAKMPRRRRR
jgi:hypothetical protein